MYRQDPYYPHARRLIVIFAQLQASQSINYPLPDLGRALKAAVSLPMHPDCMLGQRIYLTHGRPNCSTAIDKKGNQASKAYMLSFLPSFHPSVFGQCKRPGSKMLSDASSSSFSSDEFSSSCDEPSELEEDDDESDEDDPDEESWSESLLSSPFSSSICSP